jgi:regulator of sigma E protease
MFTATVLIIILLGVSTAIHEWAHFFFARRYGLPVEEFNVGIPLGPVRINLFTWRGTKFYLGPLLFGGYLKFNDKDFYSLSPVRRIVLSAAGPMTNLILGTLIFIPAIMIHKGLAPVPAVECFWHTVMDLGTGLAGMFQGLFLGGHGLDSLSGPLALIKVTQGMTGSLVKIIGLTAVLNLNLAVLNLIPFPALDGGNVVLAVLELLSRRQISLRFLRVFNYTGGMCLAILVLMSVAGDFVGR